MIQQEQNQDKQKTQTTKTKKRKVKDLYNQISAIELKKRLLQENIKRKTLSIICDHWIIWIVPWTIIIRAAICFCASSTGLAEISHVARPNLGVVTV